MMLRLAALLFLIAAASAPAATITSFQVLRATGANHVFDASRATWVPLSKGNILAESSLVQVGRDASLKIARQRESGEKLVVTIQKPGIVRLGENMVRQTKTKELLLPLMKEKKSESIDLNASLFEDMTEAWSRLLVTAFADRQESAQKQRPPQEGIAAGTSAERIMLLTPVDNTTISSPGFPAKVPVRWMDVVDKDLGTVTYDIYLWPVGEDRGAPIVHTSSNAFELSVASPGGYFLEVSAYDGRWRSKPRLITVHSPTQSINKAGERPSTKQLQPSDIVCRAPARKSLFVIKQLPVAVEIHCRLKSGDPDNYEFVAHIKTDDSIASVRSQTNKLSLLLQRFGHHVITVAASRRFGDVPATEPQTVLSKPLTVDVRAQASEKDLNQVFDGGFVYLEGL
jgi:hypothetical protein